MGREVRASKCKFGGDTMQFIAGIIFLNNYISKRWLPNLLLGCKLGKNIEFTIAIVLK